jgi:pilus assembly protein CpaF
MSLTYADSRTGVIESLDAALRNAVRSEGVDPQRDAGVVRRLAGQVVAEHDQRSLTGAVPSVEDVDAAVDELVARVSGFGALQRYLDDPAGKVALVPTREGRHGAAGSGHWRQR